MQHGQVGVVIIIASLLLSVGGGFVLNTTDVTACETEFTYVTDVAGAFTGTQGNIEIEHNPTTNITGYSVYNPTSPQFSDSAINGISYTTASSPNMYWIQHSSGQSTPYPLTLSTFTQDWIAYIKYDFGSGTSPTTQVQGGWGGSSEWVSTKLVTNGITHTGVLGTTVYDLINSYMTWQDITVLDAQKVRLYFNSSQNEYPGFCANVSLETVEVSYLHYETRVHYDIIQNDIVVNPTNGVVSIGGSSYNWNDVYAVWGEGANSTGSMVMEVGGQSITEYIDPLKGVKPISVTVDDSTQQGSVSNATHLSGSWIVSADLWHSFSNHFSYKSAQDSEWTSLFDLDIAHYRGYPFNYDYYVGGGGEHIYTGQQENDLYVYWDWNNDDPTVVKVWLHNSTMPSNAKTVPLNNVPSNGIYEISLNIVPVGQMSDIADIPSTITNLSDTPTSTTTHTGGGEYSKVTTYTTPLQVTYTTTYWSNSVENSSIVMAIQKPTVNTDNVMFVQYNNQDGTTSLEPIRLKYNGGWYFYESNTDPVNLGDWPGMLLTIKVAGGHHTYTLTPIQTFTNFQNMVVMNREYVYEYGISEPVENPNYSSIGYLQFNNTDQSYPHHEIISTTILLVDGGLYLNNGWFSPAVSFPNDEIIQFKLMSAVRTGESVTITTGNLTPYSTTYQVNTMGTGLIIDGRSYVFSDISLYYVSQNVPTITIEGDNYIGGLYLGGQFLDKGHLYLIYGKNQNVIDLGTSTNAWSIQLNGLWALSTAYYTGENVATSVVVWDKPGTWQWDAPTLLITFIAANIIGMVVCTRFTQMELWDWVIPICACVVAVVLLG